jgi:hypothetical protein
MNTNLQHYDGTVTGDTHAQVMACCNTDNSRFADYLTDGVFGTLDAPNWLNTGHMRNVDVLGAGAVQFQSHTLREGYRS